MSTLIAAIDSRKAEAGSKKFNAAVASMQKRATRAQTSLVRFQTGVRKLGTVAGGAKTALLGLAAGFGAVMAVRKTVKTLSEYGKIMAQIRGVTQATDGDFSKFIDTTRELGATTEYSASEAADSLLFLSRAGFSADEALKALPSTLDLATAGALELGDAGDIVSNVLKQFRMSTDETSHAGDVLVNTANRANTSVKQLAEALKMSGPIAQAVGWDVEEAAAAIGVLGDAGVQGTMAGRQLRGVIARLGQDTPRTRKALDSLGLTFSDVSPKTNSLVEIFEKFSQSGLDAENALDLFGRQAAVAGVVFSYSTDKLRELGVENEVVRDVMKRNADLVRNTLWGSFKSLNSVLEEAMLKTGEKGFTGALKGAVDTMTTAIRILRGMEVSVDDNVEAGQKLAVAIKGVGLAFAALIGLKIAGTIASVVSGVASLAAGLVGLLPLVIGVGAAFAAWELGAYLMDEYKFVGQFVDFVIKEGGKIYDTLSTVMGNIKSVWKTGWNSLKVFVLDSLETITDGIIKFADKWAIALYNLGATGTSMKLFDVVNELRAVSGQFATDADKARKEIEKQTDSIVDMSVAIANSTTEWDKWYAAQEKARDAEFGGGGRKGRSFMDFIKADFAGDVDGMGLGKLYNMSIGQLEKMKGELLKMLEVQVNVKQETRGWVENVFGLNGATDESVKKTRELQDIINSVTDAIEKRTEKEKEGSEVVTGITKRWRDVSDFYKDIAGAMADSLEGVINNFDELINKEKTWADFTEKLMRDLSSTIIKYLVIKPLMMQAAVGLQSLFGTSFVPAQPSAKGNVFSSGGIKKFATGGVVSSPTYFPISGGGIGVMGEAGEEAVMPLTRTANGRLGVEASGSAGDVYQTINFNFPNVSNPQDFRRTQAQVARQMRRVASR